MPVKKKVIRKKKLIDKSRGYGKSYTVRTLCLDNGANYLFDANYEGLIKYARAKGLRPPVKGELISQMIKRSGLIQGKQYYNQK